MSTEPNTTRIKILDAAEELFAAQGFTKTSLREITTAANANVAAVNYHFGSKKDLIQAVLERYLVEFIPKLINKLTEINEKNSLSLQQVFSAFIKPLFSLNRIKPNGTRNFLYLLGRGYIDSQGHLRWYFVNEYGGVMQQFVELVHKACPDLTDEEVFWRLHFTLGTLVFTISSSEALIDIAQNDFKTEVSIEQIIQKIIPFIAAGVVATSNK